MKVHLNPINLNNDCENTKRNIPFGIGARRCLGENVARMESLLFFANVMKRFRLLKMDEILSKTMNAWFGQYCQALSISKSVFISERWSWPYNHFALHRTTPPTSPYRWLILKCDTSLELSAQALLISTQKNRVN